MAIDLDVHGNTKPLEAAVQAAVNRIRRTPIKITIDDKGATQPLGNMKRGADEFTKSMEAANARILAFGASMAIINGVADAFKGMVRNMVEVEKAMADINVVMGLSTQNLDKFGDGLFKVAKEAGAAFNVAAQAATEYARQGLSVEESLKRTKDALILTRLTGMDSAEAVKALTAAMNTYGSQIKDTTQLVSKFAAVDVKFAVSAEDFAQAISRAGQSALSAGVDIDEFVGIVTAAQQKTARGGAVIGNSLKTIFTRIGRTDTLNQLESLGIAVRDIEGNVLGAKTILSDLANTFDTLSAAQKAQIAQTVGGVFQINILKAVLSDAAKQNGILAEASRISAAATDESIQKNEQLRNTMSAMATETGLAIKQVSAQIGEIMLAPGMEKILNTVKSFAEGIGGALGDGESAGGKFATGLLKGIGNVLTGPGLVMLTAVFFKLLGQAAKFTKESLTSLVGTTSEAQKQKAIQTSLVTLFGQNAALNKEMLRTDISRTEKEKIILGLLKAQVAEANALNVVSKQAASTLYRQGFGPNLTQGRRRASGHIPNYADPERAQAARGGYAAGTIRSMNMPGEGPVIYNSAETVKNFAGFKQPAIMPPQSSKAGKNYQQAFGSIHGFDPYAAGGYIPNFAQTYNADSKMVLFAGSAQDGGGYTGPDRKKNIIYINPSAKSGDKKFSATKKTGMKAVNVPYFTIGKDDKEREANDPKIKNKIQGDLIKQAQKTSNQLVNSLFKMPSIPSVITSSDVAVASGKIFEKIIMSVQKGVAKEAYGVDPPGNALLDIPRPGRDALWDLFGAGPLGSLGAEAKIALGSGGDAAHLKSAAEKFYRIDSYEGIGGAKAMAFAPKGQVSQKNLASLGYTSELQDYINKRGQEGDPLVPAQNSKRTFASWPKGKYGNLERLKNDFYSKARAYGHIPNFADPLSDAIGREKAAGVPVSQIRVGSHGALINKSNPLGLGVTNTHDEPNGLRDVFGANGFVPNYAEGFTAGDIGKDAGNNDERKALARKINEQIQSIDASMYSEEDYRKQIDETIKKQKKNGKSIELSKSGLDKADKITKQNTTEKQKNTTSTTRNTVSQQANTIASQSNTTQVAANTAKRKTLGAKLVGGIKNMNQGMGGMGLMMGLPMLAGFIPGADKPGSAGGIASGMMSGAATGAAVGMMFPGWGTAIGAAVGALGGLVSSLNESNKAIEDEARARRQATSGKFDQSIRGFIESGLSDIALKPATEVGGRYFSGYSPKPGEAFSDMMFKFSAPEEVLKKIKEGKSYTAEESYRDLPSVQQHLKTVRTQAVKSLMVEEGTSNIQKQRQALSSKMFSILSDRMSGSLSEQDYEGIKAGISKRIQDLNQQEEDIIYKVGGADVKTLRDFQEKNPEAVGAKTMEFLGRTRSQKEILSKAFRGSEDKMFSGGKIFKELFGEEQVSGKTILSGLQSKTPQEIELLFSEIANRLQDQEMLRKQENDAIILRLNKEKVLLSAQDKFNKDMRVSSNLLAEMNNQYDFELRTRGHLMTETEKAQNAYNKAINTAAAARYDSERKAEFGQTKKLITTLQGSDFEQEFKKELAAQGLSEQGFADLSVEDQKEIAIEVGKQSGYLQKINAFLRNSSQELSSLKEDYADIEQKAKNRAKTEKQITDELIRQRTGPKAFQYGFAAEQEKMRRSADELDHQLGTIVATNFRDGLVSGMQAAINQAEDLDDVLNNVAMNFLQAIQGAYLTNIANQIVGNIPMPGAKYRGGAIRNYSRGGGVPAMVTDGEYVMGRDAVNKYGGAFMHSLNAGGTIPGLSNGGRSVGDFFKNPPSQGLSEIFGKPIQGQKYSTDIKGAINSSRSSRRVFGSEIGVGRSNFLGQAPSRDVFDAINPAGGGFMSKILEMLFSPFKSLGSFFKIPGFNDGGEVGSALAANFGGARVYESGRKYQSKPMSSMFYAGQTQTLGLQEDSREIQEIMSEESRKRQEALQERMKKKAKKRALINQLIGTAVSMGVSQMMNSIDFGGDRELLGGGFDEGSVGDYLQSSGMTQMDYIHGADLASGTKALVYRGGKINKYASGGHISGKSGIDQIPAMLSEGEYVIRASSARQIGKPMLDRINAGKFNDGGAVTQIDSSDKSSTTGGNTNNISISINMDKGSNSKEDKDQRSSGENPADRSNDEQKNADLAERIKQQVVAVIVEEQRAGGLLSD